MKSVILKLLLLLTFFMASCDNSLTVVDVIDGATVLLSDGTQISLFDVANTMANKDALQDRVLDKEVFLFDISKNPITQLESVDQKVYLYDDSGICINDELSKEKSDSSPDIVSTNPASKEDGSLSNLYAKTKSAIFFVYTSDDSTIHQGSGFFINSRGLGISNFHVFKGTKKGIEVIKTADGSEYHIREVLAQNEDLDYIIFQIDNENNQAHSFVQIADNLPKIGDYVYSIGNPRGLEKTLSTGIISGYRNNDQYLQTTSEITHGSSGGALFDMQGKVVGITTAGLGEANLNFAINISKVPYQNFINTQFLNIGSNKNSLAVTKIVDGDTFYVTNNSGDSEKIRFIGINAPESRSAFYKKKEYFGKEAKEYLTNLLFGKRVRLELDVRKYDQYGRILAYVYLEDGTFVNEKIVKDGFAQAMTIPPNVKYQEIFIANEKIARVNRRGLWK